MLLKTTKVLFFYILFLLFCSPFGGKGLISFSQGGVVKKRQGPDSIYIGILENMETNPNTYELGPFPRVRVAFEKRNGEWLAMKFDFTESDFQDIPEYYPSPLYWSVVFDGKIIGKIKSKNLEQIDTPCLVGLQRITSKDEIPVIKKDAKDFRNEETEGKSRPLLLVSKPNHLDPDRWKLTSLTPEEKKKVIHVFRKIEPVLYFCKSPRDEKAQKQKYPDSVIQFYKRTFRSKNGTLLVAANVDMSLNNCDGYPPDEYWFHWFVIFPDGKSKYLGFDMVAIDAADFDNSGGSEWVFYKNEPEREGYVLFYDQFKKSVEYEIIYH